jgi:hypothetical protein
MQKNEDFQHGLPCARVSLTMPVACSMLPCAYIPMKDETENFPDVMNFLLLVLCFFQVNRMDVDCNLKNEQFVTLKNEMAAQYADLYFGRCTRPRGPLHDVLAIHPQRRRYNLGVPQFPFC